MTITVTGLHLYPVKSLGSISLEKATVLRSGIQHDRSWMAVKPDGTFLTQRTHPQMALIECAIVNNQLVLQSFGMEAMTVPLSSADMPKLKTQVWGDDVNALDSGNETAEWLSQALDEPSRLVVFPASETRHCDPSIAKTTDHTKFADAYPLLVISEESLQDLNARLTEPVEMLRFRPNIVVRGCNPFDEDLWGGMEINGITFRMLDRCARCSVPTIDPTLGVLAGPEPIHTLNTYRQVDDEVYFGVNASSDGEGEISVGDAVTVV
ncbi:MAG: MOSC domain-containing protein [Acidiferrobacterales bacterium]|nr:MOSC domain-containing protein [Acidiferrobacterales bacterium]